MRRSSNKACDTLQDAPDEGDDTGHHGEDDVDESLDDGENTLNETLCVSHSHLSAVSANNPTSLDVATTGEAVLSDGGAICTSEDEHSPRTCGRFPQRDLPW